MKVDHFSNILILQHIVSAPYMIRYKEGGQTHIGQWAVTKGNGKDRGFYSGGGYQVIG